MRIVPLIEVELECVPRSSADFGSACGLSESAVCSGALLELMLVTARELAEDPAQLETISLDSVRIAGHARIGAGLQLIGCGYDDAIEVVGGSTAGPRHRASTYASAGSAVRVERPAEALEPSSARRMRAPDATGAHVRRRAGGDHAHVAWIGTCTLDVEATELRAEVDSALLADSAVYVLHPLLWEAALACVEALRGLHDGQASSMWQPVFVRALHVHEPGGRVCEIAVRVADSERCTVQWIGADGSVVAEATGLEIGASAEAARADADDLGALRCERLMRATLGKQPLHAAQPLTELGVSSIDRARLASALAADYGWLPLLASIMESESVLALARVLSSPVFSSSELLNGDHAPALADAEPDVFERFPLTAAQRQVWALHALAPTTPRCHVHVRVRWAGPLEIEQLERSLQQLIAHHPGLRVVIDQSGDEPMQRVVPSFAVALERVELDSGAGALERASDAHARRRFDLERGPLIRFGLARLGELDHALLVTVHHLIADGFSLELIVRDLAALYADEHALDEQPAVLPDALMGVRAKRASAHPAAPPRSSAFPSRDAARRLALARDRRSEAVGRGARTPVPCGPELADALRDLCARAQVSLFSLLCSAYAYTLARHVGQDDVVVGVVIAGRSTLAQLSAVGMFARSVPLRISIDRSLSLVALARQVQQSVARLGTEVLHDPDGLAERDTSPYAATALFQQWSDTPIRAGALSLTLELDAPDGAPAGYCRSEIELLTADRGGRLTVELQSDRGALSDATSAQLARALGTLLESVTLAPTTALREVDLSRGGAVATSGPVIELDGAERAHDLVEARAQQRPDAVAVRDAAGTVIRYADLVARARALARGLVARGLGAGAHVGILAERNAQLPVVLLGVLQSGAAYVPIDPAHPSERVLGVLRDAGVRYVIALGPARGLELDGIEILEHEALIETGQGADAAPRPAAHDVAYVLHTSGSTGKPKGVRISQRSLLNFVRAMETALPAEAADGVWLALTTLAFDISLVELLFTLTRGAEVRVGATPSLRSIDAQPFEALRALAQGVTCMQCTPSLARLLVEDADGRALLSGLRGLLVGGEALPLWLAQALSELVPGEIWNMYGPTETTVWSLAKRVLPTATWIAIGTPLANTTLRVIDEHGRDVPAGLSGELAIGGAGVALGYVDRPAETAARFVELHGERMYRTGDLVRMRADGDFEWLARVDRQIKVAGHRIELGEVEGVLSEHGLVRECAVLVEVDRLIAFVVRRAQSGRSDAELQVELSEIARRKLPSYMVPTRIFVVPQLPRTSSGKTDHRALASLLIELLAEPVKEPPATPEERLLAELWSEVLALGDIGRHDDFFALGGTSFSAVLLASRARRRGLRLAPATVLAYPMLVEQALRLSKSASSLAPRNLRGDVRLPELRLAESSVSGPSRCIALTGATGFLGVHLLAELHASTAADVLCLIRAESDTAALARLQRSAADWELSSRITWSRVRCIAADLTLPRFGLASAQWDQLTHEVDCVLHNGAEVNFALGYDELRAANVFGTITAIAFAASGKRKPLHYVSTVAIADAGARGTAPTEHAPLQAPEQLVDGYAQSKWVAEGIVQLAMQAGLDARCYRAGPLVAERVPMGDAFAEALATVARSGICFDAADRVIHHLSRVDDTARAIVQLALVPERELHGRRVHHVVSPQRIAVAEVLAFMREWGFEVVELPDAQWLERVDADEWTAATMFVVTERVRRRLPLVPAVDFSATLAHLERMRFSWRPIDGVLIQRVLARLTQAPAAPPPVARRSA